MLTFGLEYGSIKLFRRGTKNFIVNYKKLNGLYPSFDEPPFFNSNSLVVEYKELPL